MASLFPRNQDAGGINIIPPFSVIAKWPNPNYVNPQRRGPALIIVNTILLSIALAVVIARLYTRLKVVRSAGLDDAMIALSMIPSIGLTITVSLAATKYYWDVHLWDMPFTAVKPSRQVCWAAQLQFLVATSLTKISILLFYRRMSATTNNRAFKWVVYGTMAFVTAYLVSFVCVLLWFCAPLRAYWDIYVKNYNCVDERATELAAAVINIFTDFMVIFIPFPTVWSLQLPRRQKWALCGIFSLGFIVCIAGIVRTILINIVVGVTYDRTWEGYPMWIWCAVEADLAIICASAPALKPLFKRYFVGTTLAEGAYGYGGRGGGNSKQSGGGGGRRTPAPGQLEMGVGLGSANRKAREKLDELEEDSVSEGSVSVQGGRRTPGSFAGAEPRREEERGFAHFGGDDGGRGSETAGLVIPASRYQRSDPVRDRVEKIFSSREGRF